MNCSKLVVSTLLAATLSVPAALAQSGPPLGFVTKLGQDMDVRSGARILTDDNVVGNFILPEIAGEWVVVRLCRKSSCVAETYRSTTLPRR